jgi:hypothetical protein
VNTKGCGSTTTVCGTSACTSSIGG